MTNEPVASPSAPDVNLADAWEAIAAAVPDADALIHGGTVRSWAQFEERAARLAAVFTAAGVGPDAKIAHYMTNGPEYVETTFASFKVRAVPVNVNYRYTATELTYLFDNSDAEAVVVSGHLAPRLAEIAGDLPKLKLIVQLGDEPLIDGAVGYEAALAASDPAPPIERSGADLWFLYTGGTTGMPKGVMWPHASLWGTTAASFKGVGEPLPTSATDAGATAERTHAHSRAPRLLPAPPLMHGTSAIASWGTLSVGGAIVTLESQSFDPVELLDVVERRQVTNLTIVGDAFARPIVETLAADQAAGRTRDLSSLSLIVSSGVMWSAATKEALLAHVDAVMADLLGSSEAVGFANSTSKRGRSARTATFRLGPAAAVFTEAGDRVEPGSGVSGVLAVGGPIPIGYYKDPDKSAGTFRVFEGRNWSVPGDHALVEADGTITLLGRGSVCINTAGEKVFPEEVEEALKTHPNVLDANVVGVADERWGQAVTAVVSLLDGDSFDRADLVAHCRSTLAGYKVPKRIVVVPSIHRGPNGKADYRWAAAQANA